MVGREIKIIIRYQETEQLVSIIPEWIKVPQRKKDLALTTHQPVWCRPMLRYSVPEETAVVAQAQALKSVPLLKGLIGSWRVVLYRLHFWIKWREKRTKSRTMPLYVTAELACSRCHIYVRCWMISGWNYPVVATKPLG